MRRKVFSGLEHGTWLALTLAAILLSACSTLPPPVPESAPVASVVLRPPGAEGRYLTLADPTHAHDAAITALGLTDTGYRFGGKNPDAGLDCSGMVSYVYAKVAGVELPHNAARIAGLTRPVDKAKLRPGDLVFFNTQNRPYSHVGLYIGEGRFVHAPSSRSKVQISSLDTGWFARRYESARTLRRD